MPIAVATDEPVSASWTTTTKWHRRGGPNHRNPPSCDLEAGRSGSPCLQVGATPVLPSPALRVLPGHPSKLSLSIRHHSCDPILVILPATALFFSPVTSCGPAFRALTHGSQGHNSAHKGAGGAAPSAIQWPTLRPLSPLPGLARHWLSADPAPAGPWPQACPPEWAPAVCWESRCGGWGGGWGGAGPGVCTKLCPRVAGSWLPAGSTRFGLPSGPRTARTVTINGGSFSP